MEKVLADVTAERQKIEEIRTNDILSGRANLDPQTQKEAMSPEEYARSLLSNKIPNE